MINSWNENAQRRHSQVLGGKDLSFTKVLIPEIINLTKIMDQPRLVVLDVGCGTGILSHILAQHVARVVGIDPSIQSARIAEDYTRDDHNVTILNTSIEDFMSVSIAQFGLAVANMTLQTIDDLDTAIGSISKALVAEGKFIFSIPHPCFWASYKKELEVPDFRYHLHSSHEIEFTISNDPVPLPSRVPYFHRPIQSYTTALYKAGFVIEMIREPVPADDVLNQYPVPWAYPRFMIMACKKAVAT